MGKSLLVDWPLIQALFIQGVPTTELSKRFGVKENTIYYRARRQKWTIAKEQAEQITRELMGRTAIRALPARSKAIREKIVKQQERVLEAVGNQPVEQMKGNKLEQIQRIVSSAAKTSCDVLGIGAQNADDDVDITHLSKFHDVQSQVIDVQVDDSGESGHLLNPPTP